MSKSTFWTRCRFTGITLILGCYLFLGAAGLIPRDTFSPSPDADPDWRTTPATTGSDIA